ncbi:MAG: fused MFS/spermidine synthase [Verrucomicrobia bacterium]|nr:fused MFS/spermidine synthase [Verrucomicrobiota bacterium]
MHPPAPAAPPCKLPALAESLLLVVVPLAAALSFVGQPMLAKPLLHAFGGTAATWLGSMVFFQTTLLLGYAFALWLERRPPTTRLLSVLGLITLAILSFHLPDTTPANPSIAAVIGRLVLASLPAYLLLFSISPLLHSELERRHHPAPYGLYAFSNLGSLAALVLYPLLIEPRLNLSTQKVVWHALLIALGGVLALLMHTLWRESVQTRREGNSSPDLPLTPTPFPRPLTFLGWTLLAAATCATMLSATNLVASEIGSQPLSWVGPFGVYLASFALTFAGRWQPWMSATAIVALATSLTGYFGVKGFGWQTVDGERFWWLLLVCGSACTVGHALLHERRPARGGSWFYLALATGGMLGGWFSVWGAPRLLSLPWEFPLLAGALLATGLAWTLRWRGFVGPFFATALLALPLGTLALRQVNEMKSGGKTFVTYRDIHGDLLVETAAESVVLSSGTTSHGSQLTADPAARRRPTFYYTENSALGRAIQRLQAERPSLRIGAIGLGAGTLAAYLRPTDEIVFWDIDPKIEKVAREHFSYLADSPGKVRVELSDGRRALAASNEDFDLILMDAFMGDGVPAHLLTRQALQLYQTRLTAREGLLVVHASVRYSDLFPVVAVTASTLNWRAFAVRTEITAATDTQDWDARESTYILAAPIGKIAKIKSWFDQLEEDDGRVRREITELTSTVNSQRDVWLDDRQSGMDTLDLNRYLFGR